MNTKEVKSREDAANEYADNHGFRVPYNGSNKFYDDVDVKASKEGFIAGAEWQAKQGCNVKVEFPEHGVIVLTNGSGDTYTSKSEELIDFFFHVKSANCREGVLREALEKMIESAKHTYDATEWPADGTSNIEIVTKEVEEILKEVNTNP